MGPAHHIRALPSNVGLDERNRCAGAADGIVTGDSEVRHAGIGGAASEAGDAQLSAGVGEGGGSEEVRFVYGCILPADVEIVYQVRCYDLRVAHYEIAVAYVLIETVK